MGRAVQTVNIDDEDDDREDDFHNMDDREDDDRDVWSVKSVHRFGLEKRVAREAFF